MMHHKEEFLRIQTCVLKVNIHCDGCKDKVKKVLQKIEGVYKIMIEAELGKVTVAGNVDPAILLKKLSKNGKRAELWTKGSTNNQFKNLQIESGKNGGANKGQQQPPKGCQNPSMKGLQDLKLPQQFVKGPKMGPGVAAGAGAVGGGKNSRAVKFSCPEDDGLSDDEYDEFDDEDDFEDDDDFDDEIDDVPVCKTMKPGGGAGGGQGGMQMPNVMMQNVMNGLAKGGPAIGGANGFGNGKKGGGGAGGNVPNHGGGSGGANGGKKGGNGNHNGGNQNQGPGGKGGKGAGGGGSGGGGGGGGVQNKNANNGNSFNANGAKKGSDGPQGKMMMPNMMGMNGGPGLGPGPMASMPMGGHMGNPPMVGQLGNHAGLSAAPSMNPGSFQGAGPAQMPAGNPFYQQQLAAMMVNQQHTNGNERFQPMMYARQPAAVNYLPSYYPPNPYPYQGPHPADDRTDQYILFSDENPNGCTVM